jgi:hypothetical protein
MAMHYFSHGYAIFYDRIRITSFIYFWMELKQMKRTGLIDFVLRQTAQSPYDHFAGSWDELLEQAETHWEKGTVSPSNQGVWIVPLPDEDAPRFFSSHIVVDETTPLHAFFAPRATGEAPYVQVVSPSGQKQPAQRVELIFYSHEILAVDGDAPEPQTAEYYLVSINAYPSNEPEPMSPMTMARNFLHLTGGTQPSNPYTAEEFAKSIVYWSNRVRVKP